MRRRRDRAEEIRDQLERLRESQREGQVSESDYAAQSARLLHELKQVEGNRRRFAET